MSTLKLKGSTSGYVELTAPAIAGNNAITLPTNAGTLVLKDPNNNFEVGTGVTIGAGASNTFTLSTNGNERIRVDSSGRLGIGTTNPTSTLQVIGNTNISGVLTATTASISSNASVGGVIVSGVTTVAAGSTSAPSITPTGDSNTGIFFPSADTVAIAEGGTEALRIDSNGRVGISTATMSYQLDILRQGGETDAVRVKGNGGNGFIRFANSNETSHWTLGADGGYPSGSNNNSFILYDRVNSQYRLAVDNSGNLNIINGNLVIGTSGKGIDFSATANSSGTMTSELLSDYEEGTFSPFSAADVTNRGISIPNQAFYIKIGRICHIWFRFGYSNTGSSAPISGNLPFAGNTPTINNSYSPFFLSVFPKSGSPSHMGFCYNDGTNSTTFTFYQNNANYSNLLWNSGCTEYTVIGAYQTS